METAKVHALQAENVKKIKSVSLELKGENLLVAGKPGQGKTTTIDLLWMALGDKKETMPISQGEEQATIKVTLAGDKKIIVTRVFKKDKPTSIKCHYEDGQKISVSDIKAMLEEKTFDPLEFYRMSEQDRVNMILKIAGVDLTSLNADIAKAEDERKTAGKIARGAEEELVQIGIDRNKPVEPVDVSDIIAKKAKAVEHNNKIFSYQNGMKALSEKLDTQKQEIEHLVETLKAARLAMSETMNRMTKGKSFLDNAKTIDTSEFDKKIDNAQEINDQAAEYKLFKQQSERAEQKRKDFKEAEAEVQRLRQEKREKLLEASWPIPALGVDEDCKEVMFKGTPLAQQGISRMTAVSFAIIAKLNPTLRVCRFDGAESLGKEGRETILKLAKKNDIQVFMSRVTDSGAENNEIIIENGEVQDA